ncbi:MAG: hypothetical protein ABTQ31_08920 [Rhizobiaceae bacterium]
MSLDERDRVRRAAFHALYREKIYAETLDMRRALVGALMRQ